MLGKKGRVRGRTTRVEGERGIAYLLYVISREPKDETQFGT